MQKCKHIAIHLRRQAAGEDSGIGFRNRIPLTKEKEFSSWQIQYKQLIKLRSGLGRRTTKTPEIKS